MNSALKKFLKITVIVFLLLTSTSFIFNSAFAATTTPTTYTNLGFLQSGIWYSKDPFFEGDTVRIYSAVFNSSEYDLVGKIEFYDNGKSIGQTDFSVTSGGKIRDVWVDFTATKGSHKFSAKIINGQLSKIGAQTEMVALSNYQTGTDVRTVAVKPPEPKEPAKEKAATTAGDTIDLFKNPPEGAAGKATEIAQKMFDFAFNTAKTTISKINDFTEVNSQKIEVKKAEVKKEIDGPSVVSNQPRLPDGQASDKATTTNTGFNLDSPIKTAYLFLLSVLGFLLSNKTLFYIFSIFVIYKILSFLIGKVSQKIAEPKNR